MKSLQSIMLFLSVLTICNKSQGQAKESNGKQTQTVAQYWFVMYSKGTNWERDSAARSKIGPEHINYIVGLRKTGKIIAGGAFTDGVLWTGCEIYNCKTKEEVIKFTEADPMVLAKIFSYEIHPWITLKGTVNFE